MKRYDLRHLKDDFYNRMIELIDKGLNVGEAGIFLFEVGDFSSIQKSADVVKANGHELMNSLKFNEVDWTIVVKKAAPQAQKERQESMKAAEENVEQTAQETQEKVE
ncbi:MAG: NADH-ubiquinone oxidoreductase subunit E family protein [Sulfurovum sp.]|nr:NADH-ubiquinone oxidoreductase subunit E family protein [Sulfurovum sp.]MDD3601883.1 NADH-ubiquinone oxidoreductase subunit E family protein [Sulfurovum sp.]